MVPGPTYDATPSTRYRFPKDAQYTMGFQTKQKSLSVGPGPCAEITPLDVYKNRSPKYPMLSTLKPLSDGKSPGPSEYNNAGEDKLRTMNKLPAYTMGPRIGKKISKTPGPADYNLMNYNPFDRAASHHFASKPKKPGCVGVYVLPEDDCAIYDH